MLKSDFCDYSDTYIAVKGAIDLLAADANENDKAEKNIAPFRSCISKTNSTLIQTMQKILIQPYRCIICQNIVKIIV